MSARTEAHVGWLRLVCAALCGSAAVWLLATAQGGGGIALGIIGLLAAVGWVFSFTRVRRRLKRHQSDQEYLELGDEALIRKGQKRTDRVLWTEVQDVSVDENRLVVVLRRQESPDFSVAPSYGELGVYALSERISDAWRRGVAENATGPRVHSAPDAAEVEAESTIGRRKEIEEQPGGSGGE